MDVLHARVPIVCLQHAPSGIEVDLSGALGDGGTGHDVRSVLGPAMERHPQLAPLTAVLKCVLMQRGLHETYTGERPPEGR